MRTETMIPELSELGHVSQYDSQYNPQRLFPIARASKRQEIGIDPDALPFYGVDFWNHYEVSWLNEKGKPVVALAEIRFDCTTTCIIESKSLKLYFNSLNNASFKNSEEVELIIARDLSHSVQGQVHVRILPLQAREYTSIHSTFSGESLDELDVTCSHYLVKADYLEVEEGQVEETLYSNLLKSNCLVTSQPDWGSVQITYKGNKINREGLLKYLISFRNHNEFHEQCIERIYIDIMRHCKPEQLSVYGRYTRRGGLDINPYRSSHPVRYEDLNQRLVRQ